MNNFLRLALGATALALAAQASAQITFYEHEGFRGRTFSTDKPVSNIDRYGFSDRASSVVVESGSWEICDDKSYGGRCVVLGQGSYDSIARMGLNDRVTSVRPAVAQGATAAAPAKAQINFYEHEGFRGRTFATDKQVDNFKRFGFSDRASSVVVEGGRWEVCEDRRFGGRCVVLRQGSYDTLARMGLNDRVTSVRLADKRKNYEFQAQEPMPAPDYAYRRRPNERIYEGRVTSARAVVGPPEERCWIERQQVSDGGRGDPNVGGAVLGAVIGGILGHQVGGGSGRDVATGLGVVGGAVIGANQGRDRNGGTTTRDVRRCETTASTTPAYWDVTYYYRGVEHHVQMSSDPGQTVPVNRKGEPRG